MHATPHNTHAHTETPFLKSRNRDNNTHTRAPTQHITIHIQTPHKTTGAVPLRRRLLDEDEAGDDMEDIHNIAGGTDIAEIDNDVHEALVWRTKDNSKPAYPRLWRYWCVFNVLVLSLDLRSAWRSYDELLDTATKRRDERDLMRFATWLCKRFKRSSTAAQDVSMVRSTHRVGGGTDIIGLGHGHQLSGCLKGLADLFPRCHATAFRSRSKCLRHGRRCGSGTRKT